MRIAISATGTSLDTQMDQRFGRCPFFVITDSGGADHEYVDNPHAQLGHGAGIQAARMLIERGVTTVLTGRCGPNAVETLEAGKIDVITGYGGTVRQALKRYATDGGGRSVPEDAAPSASGSPSGGGRGMGRGAGGGMGRGSGRGRGQGMRTPDKPGK